MNSHKFEPISQSKPRTSVEKAAVANSGARPKNANRGPRPLPKSPAVPKA